eukprot:6148446-Pleurochrysis_carterae.AAC.3
MKSWKVLTSSTFRLLKRLRSSRTLTKHYDEHFGSRRRERGVKCMRFRECICLARYSRPAPTHVSDLIPTQTEDLLV